MRRTTSGTPPQIRLLSVAFSHSKSFQSLENVRILGASLPPWLATILTLCTVACSQTALTVTPAKMPLPLDHGTWTCLGHTLEMIRPDRLGRDIAELAIPSGTDVARPRSVWERNRKYIAPVLVVIFI